MPRIRHAGEELIERVALPGIIENSQTAVVECAAQIDLVKRNEPLSLESEAEGFARLFRQTCDIAYGARSRTFLGSEAFADQVADVGLIAATRGSFLDEHTCNPIREQQKQYTRKIGCYGR